MTTMASQITSLTIVYSAVYAGADQRKHQSSPSLAFVRGIHRGPVNSPHKWPVKRKMFPFDDVIMYTVRPKNYVRYPCFVAIWWDVTTDRFSLNLSRSLHWQLGQYFDSLQLVKQYRYMGCKAYNIKSISENRHFWMKFWLVAVIQMSPKCVIVIIALFRYQDKYTAIKESYYCLNQINDMSYHTWGLWCQ